MCIDGIQYIIQMCTVLLPPGVCPTAVNIYIVSYSWFQTFAVFWMLYASFWVIQTPGNYPEESIQRSISYIIKVATCYPFLFLNVMSPFLEIVQDTPALKSACSNQPNLLDLLLKLFPTAHFLQFSVCSSSTHFLSLSFSLSLSLSLSLASKFPH